MTTTKLCLEWEEDETNDVSALDFGAKAEEDVLRADVVGGGDARLLDQVVKPAMTTKLERERNSIGTARFFEFG